LLLSQALNGLLTKNIYILKITHSLNPLFLVPTQQAFLEMNILPKLQNVMSFSNGSKG
jgi:hypothetical protein